jgi:ferredoxin
MVARVRIADTDRVFEAPEGEPLLAILQRNGHPIATSCGGVASCGLCRVVVVEGKEVLSPLGANEVTHLGNVAKIIGARLACQSRVCGSDGDVIIRVPDVGDVEERKRKKAERIRADRRTREGHRESEPRERIEWRPGRPKGAG